MQKHDRFTHAEINLEQPHDEESKAALAAMGLTTYSMSAVCLVMSSYV